MYNAPMFIGHFAVGFASKRFAPRTSFALLLAAPLLSDILWPVLLLLGGEHARIDPGNTKYSPLNLYDFPWSHSLVMCCIWATLFAGVYYAVSRYRPGAVAIWIVVVSHWVLDWISHGRDMPLYPRRREIRPRPVELDPGNNGGRNRDVRDRRRPVCKRHGPS